MVRHLVRHVVKENSRIKKGNLRVNHALVGTKALLAYMMCIVVNVRKENIHQQGKKFVINAHTDITQTRKDNHLVKRVVLYGETYMNGPKPIQEKTLLSFVTK